MKYLLTYTECQETGSKGFTIGETNSHLVEIGEPFVAVEGELVAHDLVEHSDYKNIGSIGDELRALGALWYVRGQHGEIRRDRVGSAYTPSQSIAHGVAEMARVYCERYDSCFGEDVPVYKDISNLIEYESLKEIVSYAIKYSKEEIDDFEEVKDLWYEFFHHCLKFLMKGFEDAQRRYDKHGSFYANNLFWNITEEVDKALEWCEFDGQQFELQVIHSQGVVRVNEVFEDYEDY